MILSDEDILARLESGELVVTPIDDIDMQVQPASIDLRLGEEFLEFQRTNISCIHPNRESEVSEYVTERHVPEGEEFILHPSDFVLGTTKERVEIPADLLATVEGRSSLGRLAVVIHASLPADEEVFVWTPQSGFGFHPIGDIVDNEDPAHAVSFHPQTLTVRTHRISNYIKNPTRRIFKITLASGRSVHVTRDHNLFSLDASGKIDRVRSENTQNRLVAVPGSMPAPHNAESSLDLRSVFAGSTRTAPVATDGAASESESKSTAAVLLNRGDEWLPSQLTLTPAFGRLVGVWIRNQIADQHTIPQVGTPLEHVGHGCERPVIAETVTGIDIRSPLVDELLQQLCRGETGPQMPSCVWNWDDAVIQGVLQGLLASRSLTGTVMTKTKQLASKICYLATRLGRYGSIDDSETVSRGYCVRVHPAPPEKRIPTPGHLLAEYRHQAGLDRHSITERADLPESSLKAIETMKRPEITQSTLKTLQEVYQDAGIDTDRLDRIVSSDIQFDRVVSVRDTERIEPTYDLEVQPNGRVIENFLGGTGGVFLSNTAGIVDPGYEGQITLELSNLGTAPVALTPGMRVSQLVFTELKSESNRPYGAARGSKYQGQRGPQASRIGSDPEFDNNGDNGDGE
ncbi:MAG: deoxycytidine triphosphate deaminase [Haloquadratum sp. J07HQX50]|nr:MAG: deoxycytidine triphosphate deaminase [Haloquadratum sp. J07HQX50]